MPKRRTDYEKGFGVEKMTSKEEAKAKKRATQNAYRQRAEVKAVRKAAYAAKKRKRDMTYKTARGWA